MLKLEARPQPSALMSLVSPLLALAITVLIGVGLFLLLGKDPLRGLQVFFIEPVKSLYALSELSVKATPLILIALGLAVCFRSNVWNIGAEGQFITGALAAGWVAMQAGPDTAWLGRGIVVPILLAGVLGGMAWAAIVALLRDRFNANEILVSLMLVYVAEFLLGWLVYGPWKDPAGYNFPQTITFAADTKIPGWCPTCARTSASSWHWWRWSCSGPSCSARTAALRCRSAGWPRRPRAMPAFRRVARSGWPCWCPAAWPAWPAGWKPPARWGSSRPTCRPATASRPSSWPTSGGCTRWASSSRASLMSMFYIGGELAQSRLGLPKSADRGVPGPAAVHAAGLRHADPVPRCAGKPRGGFRRLASPAHR
jgi:ABC-type uncharacterized transport system permease subunit